MLSRSAACASLLAAVVCASAWASSQPGVVVAYGFEENQGVTTADASGNGITALLVGATWTTQGKFGNALVFDGVAAHVNAIEDAPALRLTTAMTLEAWVKPSVVNNQWTDVIYKGNDNYFLMATTTPNSRPAGGGIFSGVNTFVSGTTALSANTWTHLAATYNGSALRLYVNGIQVVQSSRTGTMPTSNFPLQIGGDNIFGQFFAGTIDEVRVYGRALTQAEIQLDMNAPVVTPVVDSDPPTAPATLTATGFSGTQINLGWLPATDGVGVARYRIERCRNSGCADFVEIGQTTGTTYNDTGLALKTVYNYRVRAADASGNLGAYSQTASATTLPTAAVPGLVAAYSFNEGQGSSVADLSGTGNAGAIIGATWTPAGRYGSALAFNGTSSRVTVADAPSLDLTTGMTLEAWCYPLSIPPINCSTPDCHWMDVIVKETDCYYIEASSNIGQLAEGGTIINGQKRLVFAPSRLPVNTWTHLALTYDNAWVRLYVNGVYASATQATGTILASNRPLQIGGDLDYVQWFNGSIDEVRVYNRGLTPAEVLADMSTPLENPANNPTPATSGVSPGGAPSGGPGLTVTVAGTGFVAGSLVEWNGAPRSTTFVSPTQLQVAIDAADLTTAGTATVTVFNAAPIGGTSNPQSFVVCTGSTWYRDADGDSVGDFAYPAVACAQPAGFVPAGGDCDDGNSAVWSPPGETGSLVFPDRTTLSWGFPEQPGAATVRFDVARTAVGGFGSGEGCVASDLLDPTAIASESPVEDAIDFYVVRAQNDCGHGSWGTAAAGSERIVAVCP